MHNIIAILYIQKNLLTIKDIDWEFRRMLITNVSSRHVVSVFGYRFDLYEIESLQEAWVFHDGLHHEEASSKHSVRAFSNNHLVSYYPQVKNLLPNVFRVFRQLLTLVLREKCFMIQSHRQILSNFDVLHDWYIFVYFNKNKANALWNIYKCGFCYQYGLVLRINNLFQYYL